MDLHRQGLSVSAIARKLDLDRKTVRKYIQRGVEPPVYGPRLPRPMQVDPFVPFLKDRIEAYPGLSGTRLMREIQGLGYDGCYTSVKDALRELRPPRTTHFEHRFETAAGDQAQCDFASFQTIFSDSPGEIVTVWLFSLVLGRSRCCGASTCGTKICSPSCGAMSPLSPPSAEKRTAGTIAKPDEDGGPRWKRPASRGLSTTPSCSPSHVIMASGTRRACAAYRAINKG